MMIDPLIICHTLAGTQISPNPPKDVPRTSHNVGIMKIKIFFFTMRNKTLRKYPWRCNGFGYFIVYCWISVLFLALYTTQKQKYDKTYSFTSKHNGCLKPCELGRVVRVALPSVVERMFFTTCTNGSTVVLYFLGEGIHCSSDKHT
jgi:hypothetical protein